MMDLHCHSFFSDGTASPGELVSQARAAQLDLVALTDHDCIDGLPDFYAAAMEAGQPVLYGIEMDVSTDSLSPKLELHMLCYGFSITDLALRTLLHTQVTERNARNLRIVDKLAAMGIAIDLPADKQGTVSRAHIAKALVEARQASDIPHAFARFLSPGAAAYDPVKKPAAADVISLIHRAGGVCVLAHPMLIHADPYPLMEELAGLGMDGVEVYYPSHSAADMVRLRQWTLEHQLLLSTGSDDHGNMRQGAYLGMLAALSARDPALQCTQERMMELAQLP